MARAIYARPSDNVAVVPTLTAGTVDAAYPLANIVDLNPAKPCKLTGTSGTFRFTFGGGGATLTLIAIINHNLVGATVQLTNGAGMAAQTIVIPANTEDGHCINPFKDFSAAANRTSTTWDLAITGAAAPIAIGEVLLIGPTHRTLERNFSWGITEDEDHPLTELVTAGGVVWAYDIGVRQRRLQGEIETTDAGLASWRALVREARGRVKPWLLIPDPDVNDAWFVRFQERADRRQLNFIGWNRVGFDVEELSKGLPL